MVVVSGAFGSSETAINRRVSFGSGVATVRGADRVRSVLLPASMELPGRQGRLPDLRVGPAAGQCG